MNITKKKIYLIAGIFLLTGFLFFATVQSVVSAKSEIPQRNLWKGLKDEAVGHLQSILQKLGFFPSNIEPTKYFGSITASALSAFQRFYKIDPPAGYYGPLTRSVLSSVLADKPSIEDEEKELVYEEIVPDEIIVQFRAGRAPRFLGKDKKGFITTDNESLNVLLVENKATGVRKLWDREISERDKPLMSRHGLERTYILKVDQDKLKKGLSALKKHPAIAYAEPNGLVFTQAVPNDPLYPQQWGYPKIQAPQAWDIETGKAVVIAVIDTGVDYTHPDLAANMWKNPGEIPGNMIDDDNNGYIDDVYGYDFRNNDPDPMDDHGHGTHVAGTIAAVTNNNLGVAGTCWNCKIMAVKFFSSTGAATYEDGAKSVIYAANMGAKVLSNSWGGGMFSSTLENAINYAFDKGSLVVSAAGNGATNTPLYPAANLNSMAIGASDSLDRRAWWSTFGSWLDVAAPGVGVLSTVPTGLCGLCDPSGYKSLSGTSMATPHVSGLAGLILSKNPTWTNRQVWTAIRNSSDFVVFDQYIGKGRINALKALQLTNATAVKAEISSPSQLTTPFLKTSLVISGTAGASYVLSYGSGIYPTSWIPFASGGPITNAVLGTLDVSGLSGRYTAQLTVTDALGSRDTILGFWVDTIPPSVSITYPTEGMTLSGTVTIKASATDNIGVTKTEFYIDDKLRFTDTRAPYEFIWDTRKDKNGPHTLFAKAYDAAGNVGQSQTVSVNVDNIVEKNPPIVSITSPADGAILKGIVYVTVSATDDESGVEKVELYKNDVLFGTRTKTPYTFTWDTTKDANGQYTLQAKAHDFVGNIGTSTKITVTVDNFVDRTPPTVTFISPRHGENVTKKVVRIEVSATDNVGVTKVEFFVNGIYLRTDTSTPYEANWHTGREAAGNHVLRADAYDAAGNKGSAEITVNLIK